MTTALVSGSFDPITKGHMYLIKAGLKIADRLVIAVAHNPKKTCHFVYGQRSALVQRALREDLTAEDLERVSVCYITGEMIVDFCDKVDASIIVRGIRNTEDFVYEKSMDQFNSEMAPHITTVYLMAPPEYQSISSSAVKSLIGFTNWEDRVAKYVHPSTLEALRVKFQSEYARTKVV